MIAAAVVLLGTLAVGDRCAIGRTGQFVSGLEQIGNAVVLDPLGRGTWIADEERDEISFVDHERKLIATHACAWPERIVVDQRGRAFANCRASGSVVVMGLDGFGAEVSVGFEPRGLALDAETGSLFVGVSAPAAIVELDAASLAVRRRFDSPIPADQLALGPTGLLVVGRKAAQFGWVGVDAAAPRVSKESFAGSANIFGLGVLGTQDTSAVDFGGLGLRGTGGWGFGGLSTRGWFGRAPAVEAWHGMAVARTETGNAIIFGRMNTGAEEPVDTGRYGGGFLSRPPFAVELAHVDHRGRTVSVPLASFIDVTGAVAARGELYLSLRNRTHIARVPMPRGPLIETANLLSLAGVEPVAHAEVGLGATGLSVELNGTVRTFDAFDRAIITSAPAMGVAEVQLGAGRLSASARRGRELFHSSTAAVSGTGMSCASCHVDGREDGLVWSIEADTRQTPLLAGRIRDTAPFGWRGESPTLEGSLSQTVKRLGGGGLTPDELTALADYLRTGLREPPVLPEPASALVAHGRKVFELEAECASCHDGAAFTDNVTYKLGYGLRKKLAFNTPSLRFLSQSAPYLHDGSAKTLEQLVADRHDRMGKTSTLSRYQRAALVAYLRTL